MFFQTLSRVKCYHYYPHSLESNTDFTESWLTWTLFFEIINANNNTSVNFEVTLHTGVIFGINYFEKEITKLLQSGLKKQQMMVIRMLRIICILSTLMAG